MPSSRVINAAQRPIRELLVYEGDVSIRGPQTSERVSSGNKVQTRGLAIERGAINRADIDRAATVYASIDLLKARAAGTRIEDPVAESVTLRTSYANVFTAPTNPAYELDIAVQQVCAYPTKLCITSGGQIKHRPPKIHRGL